MGAIPDFSSHGYQAFETWEHCSDRGWTIYLAHPLKGDEVPEPTPPKGKKRRSKATIPTVMIRQFKVQDSGADWDSLKLYQQGIQLYKELSHPTLPDFLDYFEIPEGFCLVQKYYKFATPLAERQSFDAREVKQIATAVLEFLVYLQSRIPPIVYQSLKPENILMDQRKQIYLMGCPFAPITPEATSPHRLEILTPGFVPPEQLGGTKPLNETTDLYSLGVTLLCLLSGTQSTDVQSLLNDRGQFEFDHLAKRLNVQFIYWLRKLVERKPGDRFPNAAAALATLKPLEVHKIQAPPSDLISRGIYLGATAAAVILIGFGLFKFTSKPASQVKAPTPTVSASPSLSPNQSANVWISRGDDFRKQKQYEEALQAYTRATQLDPKNQLAWFYRGFCLGELKQYEAALIAYERAVELDPNDHVAWYNQGWVLKELQRYKEALIAYDRALKIEPKYQLAWFHRGYALTELAQYKDALLAYNKAVELNPKDAAAWHNRGMVLNELKRYDEALDSYNKALAISPKDYTTLNNKGFTLDGLKRFDDAIVAYDQAIKLKPDYALAWNNKGWALYQQNKYEAAIAAYDKALKIQPGYEKAVKNRQLAVEKLEQKSEQ